MTSREKIIIGLMGAALAWAAWTLLAPSGKTGAKRVALKAAANPLAGFADNTHLALRVAELRPSERAILERSAAAWPASPFAARVTATRPVADLTGTIRYSGYLRLGDEVFAILNNREYRVAESVDPGDFVVEAIHPDHVVLTASSGGRRMTVALENPEKREARP